MNVLGILLLCRLHKSCGSRDHRSPLQSLPLCWCHDWWHQFRGTPALMHQPHPSMCKMSAGSSSSMGIPSWSCLWHVTWQPGLWRNWREHNKRYLDFRVLPGVIVVPYFPNFFPLEYWLTDLCSAAHFCICLADMTAGPKPSMKMTLSKPVSPMGSWSSQKLLLHTYIILYIHYIYIYTDLHSYTDR